MRTQTPQERRPTSHKRTEGGTDAKRLHTNVPVAQIGLSRRSAAPPLPHRLIPDRDCPRRICERLRAMAMRLPSPTLIRSGAIPTGDYAYALETDGFRAIISRCNGSNVASRRSREAKAG